MNDDAKSGPPGFLLLSLFGEEARTENIVAWTEAIAAAGGQLAATGYEDCNTGLEPETPPKSVVIATWASVMDVHSAWPKITDDVSPRNGKTDIVALAGACLPEAGLPDFPTRENAAPIASSGPAAYMLIEGTVTEREPMARYRDIIFPMISARGGYYLIYAPRDNIKILHGEWAHDALIVSRWPDAALAWDFWYCDAYQTIAIPTRAGAGKFSVILLATD